MARPKNLRRSDVIEGGAGGAGLHLLPNLMRVKEHRGFLCKVELSKCSRSNFGRAVMPMPKKIILTALTISALAATSVALAQGGPGMMGYGGGPGRGWHMGEGWGPRWGGPDGMIDRVDGRLAFLKAELKITEGQSAAWNTLADAIRKSVANRTERMRGKWSGDDTAKTLIERLEVHEQFMSARLEELKQIKAAWGQLYQGLSESQKKEADEIVLPMMGMGGPGMGMRWR